ncbi:DEAD-box ATP-dependent DNA helicase Fancm [Chironomus tepperi]|uniref:DEAD-box ATP-dependent DNA helicase Fancm n=1 Tax=Chironomus tepperi TaxID=113505 RepID=UPI00391F03FC
MSVLTEADIQQELDDISAFCADMNEEDEVSWLGQLDLDNTANQSGINQSLDVSTSILNELDENTKDSWFFPVKGFEKRDYQLNISKSALFNNTLVLLPTGLGKTFIASVVIYNFLRWFPQSKIVFMAPTRPLVQQQLTACFDVVGIPKAETAEMTGLTKSKQKRKENWDTKRVFFATPQVVQSDLKEGIFPSMAIRLLVFDEAHKAKGDYAYCKVIEEIYRVNNKFRVLALTATAGKTADVIQIIQNLLISKIEHRSESSIDVHRYTHKKLIDIVEVKLTADIQEINDHFMKVVDPIIMELRKIGLIQTNQISKGYLIMQRKKLAENHSIPNNQKSSAFTHFSAAIGFFHALEILQRHSIHLFLKALRDDDNKKNFKFFIARDFKLTNYVKELEQKYEPVSPLRVNINPLPNGTIPDYPDNIDFGHPKFDILKTKLSQYFDKNGTKAIIFCEYRDTTHLIYTLLLQLRPHVRPSALIGQGGSLRQKDQLQIMKNFREGKTNTLICTCVAEEGLDIGDVDLVICFDINSKSAVRFVQRIGRTARKRQGNVIVLATEGKELAISRDLLYSKDQMNKSISRNMNNEISKYYYKGAKLFSKDFNPKCIEMKFIIPNEENEEEEETAEKKPKARKSTRKQTSKKNNVEPKNSKEAITNYFTKPAARKSKKSLAKNDDDIIEDEEVPINDVIEHAEKLDDVINLDEVIEPQNAVNDINLVKKDINFNEVLDKCKSQINELVETNGIKEGSLLKTIIDQQAEKEVNTFINLLTFFNEPIIKRAEKFELEPGDIDLSLLAPIESSHPCSENQKIIERNERLKQKKTKFMPVISKLNESNHILKSPQKSPEPKTQDFNFNSPLPIKFRDLKNASTPIISRHFSPRISNSPFASEFNKFSPKPLQNLLEPNKFSPKPNNSLIRQTLDLHKIKNQNDSAAFSQPHLEVSKNALQNEKENSKLDENEEIKKKFEFLGIMSIEDIFEGCDSHFDYSNLSKLSEAVPNTSKCTENIQNSPIKDDVISCSVDESATDNILKKFNIRNINDLFDSSDDEKSLNAIERNVLQNDEVVSIGSDNTQVYDVDEEIARIEESNRIIDESLCIPHKVEISDEEYPEVIESSQKENEVHTLPTFDDCAIKKTDSKPNLSKLMSKMQSNRILTARTQDNRTPSPPQVTTQKDHTQIRYKTPPAHEITIRSDESTPEISNKSSFYQRTQASSPLTSRPIVDHLDKIKSNFKSPVVRRRIFRKKRLPHSSFLQTQACADDNYASSDEPDEHDTSLNEFVCNDTVGHDDTMMHAKYLKSLQSPTAASNGRFVLRQLKPANLSDIYSQMPHEEDTHDEDSDNSMDSFIVDGEDESVISEVDELELAEKILKEKRRKRKLQQNFGEQKKKRKIVIADSDSSDEDELMKLRNEVLANPD